MEKIEKIEKFEWWGRSSDTFISLRNRDGEYKAIAILIEDKVLATMECED